jgi:hypothetical protein
MPAALLTESALALQQINEMIETGQKLGVLLPMKKAAMSVWSRLAQLHRIQGYERITQLMAADVAEAKQEQGAAQQLAQIQEQLKAVQKENDALRRKVLPALPTAVELKAELDAINAAPAPPQQQQALPPGQEQENPQEQQAEGGVEEPGEQQQAPPQARVM